MDSKKKLREKKDDDAVSEILKEEVVEDGKETRKEKPEDIEKKADEYLDRWKRCQADFENYRKRQAQIHKEMVEYSNINLITQVIPVLDNFHASTDHIPEKEKESPWVTGIMHIQRQLETVLTDNGVSEILVKRGDKFDPAVMEAIENKDCPPEKCKNVVSKVVMKGYKMGERVIRAARVIVE